MRFLALGIWEGGVLVKKLSGATRKVLFEARLSKGDRLLFTLGKADGQSAVYIWALVKHDDVSRRSRAGIPDNAPFLDFPTETEETVEELYLDTAPDQWHTQEGMEEKVLADYGPQKWKILDDDEWERLLSAKNVNEVDFHLYLSKERYSILACDPPLLVSGTAGSGKTTSSSITSPGKNSSDRRAFSSPAATPRLWRVVISVAFHIMCGTTTVVSVQM